MDTSRGEGSTARPAVVAGVPLGGLGRPSPALKSDRSGRPRRLQRDAFPRKKRRSPGGIAEVRGQRGTAGVEIPPFVSGATGRGVVRGIAGRFLTFRAGSGVSAFTAISFLVFVFARGGPGSSVLLRLRCWAFARRVRFCLINQTRKTSRVYGNTAPPVCDVCESIRFTM